MTQDTFVYTIGGAVNLPLSTTVILSNATPGWDWLYVGVIGAANTTTITFNINGNSWVDGIAASSGIVNQWLFELDANIPPYATVITGGGGATTTIAYNFLRGYPLIPVVSSH